MGYNENKKVVVIETRVQNCEKEKVEVNSSFLITHLECGGKTKTYMRRIKSTADPASSNPDAWQAHAQTMLVLAEGLAELGIMELDNVVLEFRTNLKHISNTIFKSGDYYEKGQKWTEKTIDNVKKRVIQLALGVLHCLIKKFRAFGGSIEVRTEVGYVKGSKGLDDFKKLTMLKSGLRAYNDTKIEKKVVVGVNVDKKLIELAVEGGYEETSDNLFNSVIEKYEIEKKRRVREAAKANAIHTSRFRKAQ